MKYFNKGSAVVVAIIVIIVLAIIGGGVWYYVSNKPEPRACTLEAKLCPDGSYVSRIGPNCEFADCPIAEDQFKDWKTYTNEKYGFEFKYPQEKEVNNKFYITDTDGRASTYGWPNSTILLLGCDYCQSYEMVVQIWNNESQFKNNCEGYCNPELKQQLGDKYLTVTNNNKMSIIDQILSTFKFTK